MKLHTSLSTTDVYQALSRAQKAGHVTPDIDFQGGLTVLGSRSHERAFEVQLGTHDKASLPAGYTDQNGRKMTARRYKNSGGSGTASGADCSVWSATWHEWGWFMAEVFRADPGAMFGSKSAGHHGADDFSAKTHGEFCLEDA